MPRALPQTIENEAAVLGALIIDVDNLVRDQIFALLRADHFSAKNHQVIFKALADMHDLSMPIELITLRDELKHRNQLRLVGGAQGLADVCEQTPSVANTEHYAREVLQAHLRREVIKHGETVKEIAFDQQRELREVLAESEKITNLLSGGVEVGGTPECMTEIMAGIKDPAMKPPPISTPFIELNAFTNGGFRPGELIVVAARTSVGKTSYALNIAEYVAVDQNIPVQVVSLEMQRRDLLERMLCRRAEVPLWKLRGKYPLATCHIDQFKQPYLEIKKAPLYICDHYTSSMDAIKQAARVAKRKQGIELLIIDYLQLVRVRGNLSTIDRVSMVSKESKLLASELEISIILISQINRSVEQRDNKRPLMSDLRESGAIEDNADVVILLYRNDYYYKNDPSYVKTNICECIVAKNRNGATGIFNLTWSGELMEFKDYE